MDEPKFELLTNEDFAKLYTSGLAQAEVNLFNAYVNYVAAKNALEAIRASRSVRLAPPVVPVNSES